MSKYTSASLESLAARLDVDEVLADIHYRPETVQRSGDRLKCFCPIHRETILRSLTIEIGRKRFKCGYSLCPGSRSGNLLRLWALAKKKEEWQAAEYWAKKVRFKLELDPEWKTTQPEGAAEAGPAPEPEPPKAAEPQPEPPKAAKAKPAAKPEPARKGGKVVIKRSRPEPAPPPEPPPPAKPEADILVRVQKEVAGGRPGVAGKLLAKHLQQHPDDLEAVQLSVALRVQENDRQGAADLLERMLRERRASLSARDLLTLSWKLHELEPESAAAVDVMAEIYQERGQAGEALEKWYQSADIWHRRGDRKASMARLERVLSLAGDETKALEALAKLHVLEKNPTEALATLLRVAHVYLEKDMLGQAGDACQRALKLASESLPALLLYAEVLSRRGMEAESTEAVLRAVGAQAAAGKRDEAVQLLFATLEKRPDKSSLREKLAELLAATGRTDAAAAEYALLAEHFHERDLLGKAVDAIRQAAELHPENTALRERLLDLLLEKGDTAAAEDALTRWAAEAEAGKDYETALAYVERLQALLPAHSHLHLRVIELLVQAGQAPLGYERLKAVWTEAEARQDSALLEALTALGARHWPDRPLQPPPAPPEPAPVVEEAISLETLMARAQAAVAGERLDEAAAALEDARALQPEATSVLAALVEVRRRQGQLDAAFMLEHELARLFRAAGDEAAALAALLSAMALKPDEEGLRLDLVDRLSATGRHEDALRLLSEGPASPALAARRIALYRQMGAPHKAAQELPAVLEAACEAGDPERALALYRDTREWAGMPPAVALGLADALYLSGRSESAVEVLLAAAEEAAGQGDRDGAQQAYRKALELEDANPRLWQAYLAFLRADPGARAETRRVTLSLADVYVRRDQVARALRLLDEAYAQDPEALEFLLRRIQLEAEEGHPDRAAGLCVEAAAKLPPEQAEQVVGLLERATELAPQNAEAWQALFQYYAAAGRFAEEMQALEALIDLLERKGLVGKCLSLLEEARRGLSAGGGDAVQQETALSRRLVRLYEAKGDWRSAAREYLRLAELAEASEGIEAALGWIRKGLERDPEFLRLRFSEARLLSRMLPPADVARRLAGLAAQLAQKPARDAQEEALLDEVVAELLALAPQHVDGLLLLARRQLERDERKAARETFLAACTAAESAENWESAMHAAEAVRRLDPQDPEILLRLAGLHQRRGETARAVACRRIRLESMLAAWQEKPGAKRRAAVLAESEAMLALEPSSEEARRARLAVFEADKDGASLCAELYGLLETQAATGQHRPQVETYQRLLSLEPDNAPLRHRFAVHLEGMGRLREAVEQYLLLAARLEQSQPEAAQAHYRRILQLDPTHARAREALAQPEPEPGPTDPLLEADTAAAAGDARRAETLYRQLLESHPAGAAVRERLVRLYASQGDAEHAIQETLELCRVYEEEGRLLETVELLRQAVGLDPDRWNLHAALADRYQRFGNFTSAEAEYREALRLLPAARDSERRELYRQLVAVTPGDLSSLRTLERSLSEGALSSGELLEAESVRLDMLRLLSLEPPSRRNLLEAEQLAARIRPESAAAEEAHLLLAGVAMRVSPALAGTHRVYLAVQHFLAGREHESLEEVLAALALPQLETVDLSILAELTERLGQPQEHRAAARRLAARLLATGRVEEGLAQWRGLTQAHPQELALRAEFVAALETTGNTQEAREQKLALSAQYLELAERVEAIKWCRAALSLPPEEFNRLWEEGADGGAGAKSPFLPEDVPVLLRLAEIHRAGGRAREEARVFKLLSAHCAELGQSEPAVAYARRVLSLLPDDASAHAQLVALFEATGDVAGALAARVELARLWISKELPERALATFRAALERASDAVDVREELATVLSDLGRAEESTSELLSVVERLCSIGQAEEALARLSRFVEKDPGNAALCEALARLLQTLGREAEAVAQYLSLGDLYRRSELTRKAQETYERALELDPQSDAAAARLAGVLSDRGRDREAAEQWLKLARLRLRTDDRAGAAAALASVLAAAPEHPAANDLLITTLEAEAAAGRETDPEALASAYRSRARRDLSARAYREALEWARKAAAIAPGDASAATLEEEISRALSREQPQEHLEVRQETLVRLLGEGDTAGALALLERLLLDYPDRVDLARQLAQLYRETRRPAEAASLLVQQGRRRLDRGEAGVAVELLREAYHHSPENAAVGEVLLDALLAQGEREAARSLVAELGQRASAALPQRPKDAAYQAAARWFRRGLELWPEWEQGYEALVELAEKANRPADAIAWLEELVAFLEKEKRHDEALRAGQRLLSKLPEPDARELKTHLDRAQEKARRRLGAQMSQADFLVRLGRPEEAAETLMLAAHLAARAELAAEATQLYARVIELTAQERILFSALEGQAKLHAAAGHAQAAAQVLWSMVPLYERAADQATVHSTCRRILELAPEHRAARERLYSLLSSARGPQREERLACGLALAQLYRDGDLLGKAEEVYRQLLEEFPGDDEHPAPAFAPLASLYSDKGEEERLIHLCLQLAEKSGGRGHFRRQVDYYRRILKLREDDLEARKRLPGAYYAAGDFEHALAERVNLAILYLRQNQPVQALDTIRDILRQQPDHSVILELLDVLVEEEALRAPVLEAVKAQVREFMQESPEEARPLLLAAGRWATLDASVAPLLAAAWAAVGDRDEAVRWGIRWAETVAGEKGDASSLGPLRKVLEWDPQNPDVVERINVLEGAVSEQRAEAHQKSLLQSSLLLFAQERWSEAAAGFAELLALSPDDAEVKLRLAQALSRLARAGAEGERDRAAALFLELAEHEDRRGNGARAEEHMENAVALRPDSLDVRQAQIVFLARRGESGPLARAHADLAALCLEKGEEERALAAYRTALELAPDQVELLAATAELLSRKNQLAEARDLYLQLAERELSAHRIVAAISAYQRALTFQPDDAEVLDRLADAYVAKGELSSALAQRRRRIALFRERGRREEMLSEYARLAQLDEENAQLLVEWAGALRDAGRKEEAADTLRRAAQKYRERELLGKAAEIYRGLLEESAHEVEAGAALARCHADMGQAEAAAQTLLEVSRRHLAAGDMARAEESLRKALEYHPRSRSVRRALADLFAGRGDVAGAVDWLLQLAALHRESGSPDRAAQVFSEVLEQQPEHEEACRLLLRCLEETGEEKRRLATLERLAQIHEKRGETDAALAEYLALVDHYLAAAEG